MVKVSIKWGKESYNDVEMDASDGFEGVQAVIFSLTNVPADRQKIIAGGKMIKDSSDVSKVIIKDGIKIMVTGTADAIAEPVKKTVFLEDLSESEKLKAGSTDYLSAGLSNLGNTCYMNSTLQSLRFIQPLKDGILSYMNKAGSSPSDVDPHHTIVSQLGNLYKTMDNTTQPITPLMFTQSFRHIFPQFAEKDEEGHWRQQDADECLNTLLSSIADKLSSRLIPLPNNLSSLSSSSSSSSATPTPPEQSPLTSLIPLSAPAGSPPSKPFTNLIDFLFSGDMESVLKCKESDAEEEKKTIESFRKLRCPIDLKISYLSEGIEKDLNEELERRSEKLGRNALWSRRSQISRLPPYLIIQFVRFFWKNDVKQKAKVLRKVEFPMKFDIFPFCTNKLKTQLKAARRIIKDEQDAKIGISPLELAKKKAADALAAKKTKEGGGAAAATTSSDEKKKEENNNNNNNNEGSLEEMANVDYIATSGYYEVFAVVTHKGRSADGGHYVGWVRTQPGSDKWLLFDDDKVSAKTSDDIKELSGGGDWHTAYLTLYRRIDDMTTFADRFKRIAQGLPPFTQEEIAEMQKAAGHGPISTTASAK